MSGQPEPRSCPEPRRRGRPVGSVALTEEKAGMIVGLIRAGVFDYVAAEAAGFSARTFREYIERGEGTHPTRGPTPKLRKFAEDVRRAKAEARALAETSVYREKPERWLARAARSKPDREGWTNPPRPGEDDGLEPRGLEAVLVQLEYEEAIDRRCPDANCSCTSHRRAPDGSRDTARSD